jgi:hypothetical protein
MKNFTLLIFILAGLMTSCGGGQLNPQYVYEKNPQYTWGYAEFYGAYYFTENSNKNNVLSISLFTNSLKINNAGSLTGLGQFLILEDVFISPTDTILPVGNYTVNNSGLPFTVAPGKNDTVDNDVFPIGATISYYEENSAKSTLKIISSGSLKVSLQNDTIYNILCNFKTTDSLELKGSFTGTLPHFDRSIHSTKSFVRKRLNYSLN